MQQTIDRSREHGELRHARYRFRIQREVTGAERTYNVKLSNDRRTLYACVRLEDKIRILTQEIVYYVA